MIFSKSDTISLLKINKCHVVYLYYLEIAMLSFSMCVSSHNGTLQIVLLRHKIAINIPQIHRIHIKRGISIRCRRTHSTERTRSFDSDMSCGDAERVSSANRPFSWRTSCRFRFADDYWDYNRV